MISEKEFLDADTKLRKVENQTHAKWRYFLLTNAFSDAAHVSIGDAEEGRQVMKRNFL